MHWLHLCPLCWLGKILTQIHHHDRGQKKKEKNSQFLTNTTGTPEQESPASPGAYHDFIANYCLFGQQKMTQGQFWRGAFESSGVQSLGKIGRQPRWEISVHCIVVGQRATPSICTPLQHEAWCITTLLQSAQSSVQRMCNQRDSLSAR